MHKDGRIFGFVQTSRLHENLAHHFDEHKLPVYESCLLVLQLVTCIILNYANKDNEQRWENVENGFVC